MSDELAIPEEAPKPWDRTERETPEAYAAFWYYCQLPVKDRSQAKVSGDLHSDYEIGEYKPKSASGRISAWASKHRWVERAAAYDAWFYEEERKAALQARLEEERQSWAERARQREKIKRLAERAIDRAEQLLDANPGEKGLRDTVLAAERAACQLLEKAYEGIRDAYQVDEVKQDDMDPQLAAEIHAAMARDAERRLGTLTIEARAKTGPN